MELAADLAFLQSPGPLQRENQELGGPVMGFSGRLEGGFGVSQIWVSVPSVPCQCYSGQLLVLCEIFVSGRMGNGSYLLE